MKYKVEFEVAEEPAGFREGRKLRAQLIQVNFFLKVKVSHWTSKILSTNV